MKYFGAKHSRRFHYNLMNIFHKENPSHQFILRFVPEFIFELWFHYCLVFVPYSLSIAWEYVCASIYFQVSSVNSSFVWINFGGFLCFRLVFGHSQFLIYRFTFLPILNFGWQIKDYYGQTMDGRVYAVPRRLTVLAHSQPSIRSMEAHIYAAGAG